MVYERTIENMNGQSITLTMTCSPEHCDGQLSLTKIGDGRYQALSIRNKYIQNQE